MIHQSGKKKLNLESKHRKALIRNQAIHFIKYGSLKTTLAKIKEVRRVVEKVVTIAKKGNHFNNRRKANAILPYDLETVEILFKTIAPKYSSRNGGYTRIFRLQQRVSDTAQIGKLLWVEENIIENTSKNEQILKEVVLSDNNN